MYIVEFFLFIAASFSMHRYGNCVSMVTGDVVVSEDEEYFKVKFDKIKSLRTVFKKDGKLRH